MFPIICEFVGTFMLTLLGNGVNANVGLNKSGFKGGGPIVVSIAWGFAIMIPAFIFGPFSGGHLNPALTIGFAVGGLFPWASVPGYIIAQFAGAFCGAALVSVLFHEQFKATEDQDAKLGVFATSPAVRNIPLNILSEATGTFILMFGILGISTAAGFAPAPGAGLAVGMNNLYIFGLIVAVAQSFGGLTGFAINPARDWGPRLAHTLMPIPGKGSSHWGDYALVPFVGPVLGAVVAVLLYQGIFALA